MSNSFYGVVNHPFRPGAGHPPLYLAGRTAEQDEMRRLLKQTLISENLVLTGLRGVGKTVLLEKLRPIAFESNWLWAGNDLSESASVTESNLAIRILTDISLVTSSLFSEETREIRVGFERGETVTRQPLNYDILTRHYNATPGLVSDKLKATLEFVWQTIPRGKVQGIVFAYDEAQNLADHAASNEYPLSLLLEVFQSLQRKGVPFMLVLTGLPTLFPKLVGSRTYSERMFHIMFLKQLTKAETFEAISIPIQLANCPMRISEETMNNIFNLSGGYPYFVQFICKVIYDVWIEKASTGQRPFIPTEDIIRKLDTDFFSGRWANTTDRQRELLLTVARLPCCDDEFTVQEIAEESKNGTAKAFSPSQINQMLGSLAELGLVYKNRHGKYSLGVPLFSQFIKRQIRHDKAYI